MSQATIAFSDHDQIRALFGAKDRFLRQVRDQVGIDVVLRGDEIRLQGTDEQIQRGLVVFSELKAILERNGGLQEAEVLRVLAPAGAVDAPAARQDSNENERIESASPTGPPIALFEQAKEVRPRTPGQTKYVKAIRENDLVFCAGPAGCGKTYLAVAMAINALRSERVRKIVLVRPAVEAGEKLGFLPGDMFAKVNPYLRPLLDALNDILNFDQVGRYMERDLIEIVPLAFMRGRTLNDTFIILDEGQNTTVTQMKMFLTRMGMNSKIVVTGDITQLDLPNNVTCGLTDAIKRLGRIDGVGAVHLTSRDIVRHRLVKEIVHAYDARDHQSKSQKS